MRLSLIHLSILVVLFALAAVPVSKMRRELRQTELDSKAEILFQTAQNRMTQLLAAGMEEKYKNGGDVKRFTYIPVSYTNLETVALLKRREDDQGPDN